MTSEIYRQAKERNLSGAPRLLEMKEVLPEDYDFAGLDRGEDDPIVEPGFFSQTASIADLDIWYEPNQPKPEDPPLSPDASRELAIAELLKIKEQAEDQIRALQNEKPPEDEGQPIDDDDDDDYLTFGS